ncbi:MAG: ketoacyl-ACP synthase III [candidate division Zixibacteria bacterium]|nr:ketoacyl-ACP synthase III [candidate division Zixibacteria bacterium]
MIRAKIIGLGSYVPERVLTNDDFEKIVETSNEWIVSRTGIMERHIARPDEDTSDMCVAAAREAFASAGVAPEEIDLVIAGTVTPDFRVPSMSCIIQKKLGLLNAATMDIVAACAGFIHGLSVAQAYIASGTFKRILVFGAEKLSSITDYTDRSTCILFGDAAGAAIIGKSDDDSGILAIHIKSDGRYDELLNIPAGGTHLPYVGNGSVDPKLSKLHMKGNEVFKYAVRHMGDAALRVITEAGLTPDQVDLLVPHQANIRIIKATAARLGLPMDKVYLNIEKYGNTSAASIPLALDHAVREGRIKKGDIVLGVAFGGGLTWGAVLFRW